MLSITNGIYQQVLDYQANMLTDDYMLIPVSVGKLKTSDKVMKVLEEQANFISKYNIKYNAKWMRHKILKNGELFIYKVEGSDGNIIQELPNVFCKIVAKENEVHRYAINLSKLNDNIIICVSCSNIYYIGVTTERYTILHGSSRESKIPARYHPLQKQ